MRNTDIDIDVVNQAIDDLTAFVNEDTNTAAGIVMLPVNELHPHPENPRTDVGDVTELAASIKAGGLHQNLTVIKAEDGDGYTVIIGHRRLAACKSAGVETVPCSIVEMDHRTQIATMLAENMQRVDLTVAEQAKSMQLCMDLGETVDGLAEKTGFSKATVKHRLELAKLDHTKVPKQITVGDMELLEKVDSIEKRNDLLQYAGTSNLKWWVDNEVSKQEAAKAWAILKPIIEERSGRTMSTVKEYDSANAKRNSSNFTYDLVCYKAAEEAFCYAGGRKETLEYVIEKIKKSAAYVCNGQRLNVVIIDESAPKEQPWEKQERERKEQRAKLEQAWNRCLAMRCDYIKHYEPTAADVQKIDDLFFKRLCSGNYREYARSLCKALLPDIDHPNMEQWTEAVGLPENKKKRTLWLLTMDLCEDSIYNWCGEFNVTSEKNMDQWKELADIIGYEPSDAEQALMDGTSDMYKKEEHSDGI